jgi:hypothetical protein
MGLEVSASVSLFLNPEKSRSLLIGYDPGKRAVFVTMRLQARFKE